jgi:hypothetical protein
MAANPSFPNNPYAVLERTWRDISKRDGPPGATYANGSHNGAGSVPASSPPVSPSGGVGALEPQTDALNLSAVCMSNIMMLEDKHLPSVIVRMYEFCLERSVTSSEEDPDNEARLRLLNFIIHRWHETREKLMFIRDAARILAALSRSVVGDHLSIAVEATTVNQQHVMRELMRTIRKESRGMTLGEFLERYSTAPSSEFLFHDMAFELFDREDVYDYDRAVKGGFMDSYIGEMLRAPVMLYLRRVLVSMIRAFCNLKLHVPSSVSERLFSESVPSWVEEDTEMGMQRMDSAARERLQLARENIGILLMQRKERPRNAGRKRAASPDGAHDGGGHNGAGGSSSPNGANGSPRTRPTRPSGAGDMSCPTARKVVRRRPPPARTIEDDFIDSRTIDTASFLGDLRDEGRDVPVPSLSPLVEQAEQLGNLNTSNKLSPVDARFERDASRIVRGHDDRFDDRSSGRSDERLDERSDERSDAVGDVHAPFDHGVYDSFRTITEEKREVSSGGTGYDGDLVERDDGGFSRPQPRRDDTTLVRLCDTERDLLDQITSRIGRRSNGDDSTVTSVYDDDERGSTISMNDVRESTPATTIRSFTRADHDLSALAEHDRREDRLIEQVVSRADVRVLANNNAAGGAEMGVNGNSFAGANGRADDAVLIAERAGLDATIGRPHTTHLGDDLGSALGSTRDALGAGRVDPAANSSTVPSESGAAAPFVTNQVVELDNFDLSYL